MAFVHNLIIFLAALVRPTLRRAADARLGKLGPCPRLGAAHYSLALGMDAAQSMAVVALFITSVGSKPNVELVVGFGGIRKKENDCNMCGGCIC